MIKKYELKDGSTRYHVQVYIGKGLDGKDIRVNRQGIKSYRQARDMEARIRSNPEEFADKKKEVYTYGEVYERWLKQYKNEVEESTLHKTKTIFRLHILPVLENERIDKIEVLTLQDLINQWALKFKNPKTYIFYMKKVFTKAYQWEIIDRNPCEHLDMPKKKDDDPSDDEIENYYSKEELNQFLKGAKERGLKWYALFRTLAYSGMRQQELLALTWKDIDFANETIDINKAISRGLNNRIYLKGTKNKASKRIVPMDKQSLNILKQWKHEQSQFLLQRGIREENQLLFPVDTTNKYMTTSQIRTNLIAVQESKDLDPISAHGFRHTHTSVLFEAGLTPETVRLRLGHSDIETTMNIYTHVTKERQNKVADTFADFMEN